MTTKTTLSEALHAAGLTATVASDGKRLIRDERGEELFKGYVGEVLGWLHRQGPEPGLEPEPEEGDEFGEYSVVRAGGRGIVVRGPLPVSEMAALCSAWAERGYTLLDAAIAQKLGATLVVVSEEGGKRWRKELGL